MSLLHRFLSWDISLRRQDIQIQKFVPTKKKNPLMEFLRRCIQGKASKPHTLWMRKRKRFSFVIFLSSRCWIQQILWSSSYISVTPAFTVKVSFLGEFPLGHFSKLSLVFSSLLIYFLKENAQLCFESFWCTSLIYIQFTVRFIYPSFSREWMKFLPQAKSLSISVSSA